jgi:hypothetical protein
MSESEQSGQISVLRKTSHPVAVELFVKFALANLFMNDFAQCAHTFNAKCRDGRQLLTF